MTEIDDNPNFSLKEVCCTCLSKDRSLIQLCKIRDGVNDLYLLLSYDSEAYVEGFFRESASLFMCWECRALMRRISRFRGQACIAQKQLTSIAEGRTDVKSFCSLSHLTNYHKATYDSTLASTAITDVTDNFIDCNNDYNIKTELDDMEDEIPLAKLHKSFVNEDDEYEEEDYKDINSIEPDLENNPKVKLKSTPLKHSRKKTKLNKKQKVPKTKVSKTSTDNNEYFKIDVLSEKDMLESREKRKMAANFSEAKIKCESCIEVFMDESDLERHNSILHCQKPKHAQCPLCLCYCAQPSASEHRRAHYLQYTCLFCEYIAYSLNDIVKHLKFGHAMKNLKNVHWRKGLRQTPKVLNPGSRPRMNPVMKDKRTPYGYQCTDCSKYFETKRQRWMHIMRCHKEGFRCHVCGKRFPLKYNLIRHELLHKSPPPRQECEVCHKMVRVDLLKTHSETHKVRERRHCVACDKTFASTASYYHHLKYTLAHATTAALETILKYKCSMCDKGYRSQAELRDHENYQHRGETQHKCPVCGKALATIRCVRRHVKRSHQGIKENEKDKICQQCGKAFRDKKTLKEHELTHTGERPLSCEVCGNTFRQYASLYTHRKRVHKIHRPRKQVQLLETAS